MANPALQVAGGFAVAARPRVLLCFGRWHDAPLPGASPQRRSLLRRRVSISFLVACFTSYIRSSLRRSAPGPGQTMRVDDTQHTDAGCNHDLCLQRGIGTAYSQRGRSASLPGMIDRHVVDKEHELVAADACKVSSSRVINVTCRATATSRLSPHIRDHVCRSAFETVEIDKGQQWGLVMAACRPVNPAVGPSAACGWAGWSR